MERLRTEEDDATEGLADAGTSSWVNDETTEMARSAQTPTTSQHADPDEDLICEALHLAASAIHLDIAWHAGVISVEAAMEGLHKEIVEAVHWCTRSALSRGFEISSRSPMQATALKRKTCCG